MIKGKLRPEYMARAGVYNERETGQRYYKRLGCCPSHRVGNTLWMVDVFFTYTNSSAHVVTLKPFQTEYIDVEIIYECYIYRSKRDFKLKIDFK